MSGVNGEARNSVKPNDGSDLLTVALAAALGGQNDALKDVPGVVSAFLADSADEGLVIKAVVHDLKVAKVVVMGVPDVPGAAGRLFASLAERGVGTEMIIQNHMRGGLNDIGFLILKENLDAAIDVCRAFSRDVEAQGVSFSTEIARVSVVGAGIANHPDIPSRMFSTLGKEGINIEMISSTGLSVTCVVSSTRAADAVRALREHFIPS